MTAALQTWSVFKLQCCSGALSQAEDRRECLLGPLVAGRGTALPSRHHHFNTSSLPVSLFVFLDFNSKNPDDVLRDTENNNKKNRRRLSRKKKTLKPQLSQITETNNK